MRKLSRPLYIHIDVSDQLERDRRPLAKRFSMICRRLAVDEWVRFKPTRGANAGWRRSPLGGTGGSHFYMWWVPSGSGPGKALIEKTAQGVAIRSVRHHDLTDKPIELGDFEDYWAFKFVEELDDEQLIDQPWTDDQRQFIDRRGDCQILIGPPGSGKTSSLWRAIEVTDFEGVERGLTLYITWSQRLAETAESYFKIMAPGAVKVYDLNRLFAKCLTRDVERIGLSESRRRFLGHVEQMTSHYTLKRNVLRRPDRYFDLIRAWVFGRAPWALKRVGDSKQEDEQERLIQEELTDAKTLYEALKLTPEQTAHIFPELAAAQEMMRAVIAEAGDVYHQVVIDEVQDLTPLELEAMLKVAQAWSQHTPKLLIAGDEGQVVRPTYFEFAELNDQLFAKSYHPQTSTLSSNLRSPKVIADCVTRAKRFNRDLGHKYRPSDQVDQVSTYEAEALLALTLFDAPEEARTLLYQLSRNPRVAFIHLYDTPDSLKSALGTLDAQLEAQLNTPEAVKGLEFVSVCVVGASHLVSRLSADRATRDPLEFRLDVNRLRVAMSRAVEHLVFIEPRDEVDDELRALIGGDASKATWHSHVSTLTEAGTREGLILDAETILTALAPDDLSADERAQGFYDRAERLFFDDQRGGDAYRDLLDAHEIILGDEEVDEEISSAVTTLASRLLFTDVFRAPEGRQLSSETLTAPVAIEFISQTGGAQLVSLKHALYEWSNATADLVDLRQIYTALRAPEIQEIRWLSRVLSERKYEVYQSLLEVATVAEDALGEIEDALEFIGFEGAEVEALSLPIRRRAFDALIDQDWVEAERVWREVTSAVVEDRLRDARLHEAKEEWRPAGVIFEALSRLGPAFRCYRLAGAYAEAIGLIEGRPLEEIEGWDVGGLDLVCVFTEYLDRHPLSPQDKAEVLSHGDHQIAQLKRELAELRDGLSDRASRLGRQSAEVERERGALEEREERLRHTELELEYREARAKRQERLSRAVEPLSAPQLELEEETQVGIPALVFSDRERELNQREERLQGTAEALSKREAHLSAERRQIEREREVLAERAGASKHRDEALDARERVMTQQLEMAVAKEGALTDLSQKISLRERKVKEKMDRTEAQARAIEAQRDAVAERERVLENRAHELHNRQAELNYKSRDLQWHSRELEARYREFYVKQDAYDRWARGLHPPSPPERADLDVSSEPRAQQTEARIPRLDPSEAFSFHREEESAVEETAVEETAVEETAVEETAVEETAVEETAVEETAVEETAVEETAVEETAVDLPAFDLKGEK